MCVCGKGGGGRGTKKPTVQCIIEGSQKVTQKVTLKMSSAQVVETSVNVISNSPSQEYTHPDDHTLLNYEIHSVYS